MIQFPYAITGGMDELATRFGELAGLLDAGPTKDTAMLLAISSMKVVQEGGEIYWNDTQPTVAAAVSQLQSVTPNPGGFIVPQGTVIASKAHLARTWGRYLLRVDVGDNGFIRGFLSQASIWAYWMALFDNNANGVAEVLVP